LFCFKVLRQGHLHQSAANATIAIFKGMNGFKPQVCQCGTHQTILPAQTAVKPLDKEVHVALDIF